MTRREDRQTLAAEITEACAAGARLSPACTLAGIDVRTFQRWRTGDGLTRGDRRPEAVRPSPSHALSEVERARIVALANEPRFASTPPARIVPALADEGVYVASEASFHRVLRDQGQMQRRGRARPPRPAGPPSTHVATGPGQVWCWDVTFLPTQVQGRWFYLFLILDLFSRKIVGFEVHATDQAEHAAHLVRRTALAEGIHARALRPVLHGDNGASVKGTTVLAMLHWLGIVPSHSRPRVSDDNAYAEALFRTAKYRPEFPSAGFADLADARQWAAAFVNWYNCSSQRTSLYVVDGKRVCCDGCGTAAHVRARRTTALPAGPSRSDRWNSQGPSASGCTASISPRLAASLSVRGATPSTAAALDSVSQGSNPSAVAV
jgi:putative transposase